MKALLFDFDGLLIDTETPAYRAWQEAYRDRGLELELSKWSACLGTIGGFDPAADLSERSGSAFDGSEADRRLQRRLELIQAEPLRPGIARYLKETDARCLSRAIVTSSGRTWVDEHLARVGAAGGWDTIRCADGDPAIAKPAPTLYLAALDDLGVGATEALVLEDSPNGIAAARAAGIFCVAVPNPVTAQLDLGSADARVDDLEAVPLGELIGLVPE